MISNQLIMFMSFSLLSIAMLNAITAYLTYRTHMLTKKIETSTNSMQDKLISATEKASFAEGHDKARIEGEDRAAALKTASGKTDTKITSFLAPKLP